MLMTTYMLLFLVSQALIAITSGEVTLRFLAWYYSIAGQHVKLAPMILGIALVCGALWCMEIEWMATELVNARTYHNNVLHGFHDQFDFIVAIIIRLFLFTGVCSLNYPVLVLNNTHDRQFRMLWIIKAYIILCSFSTGVIAATVFWHHVCKC